MSNPKVYLDITIDGKPIGRIVIELFADMVPRTAEKFWAYCTGERGHGYKGSSFYNVKPPYKCAGGLMRFWSIEYDDYMRPENFIKKFDKPGAVPVYMVAPDLPAFIILTNDANTNNHGFVVVGQVVDGLDIVNAVINVDSDESGKPSVPVVIADCGESLEKMEVISKTENPLLNSLEELKKLNKEVISIHNAQVNASEKKTELKKLGEMMNILKHNEGLLSDLKAEINSLEEHHGELLSRTQKEISIMNSEIVLESIPGLQSEELVKIEDAIKKLKMSEKAFKIEH